jgi:hypothetical protein
LEVLLVTNATSTGVSLPPPAAFDEVPVVAADESPPD